MKKKDFFNQDNPALEYIQKGGGTVPGVPASSQDPQAAPLIPQGPPADRMPWEQSAPALQTAPQTPPQASPWGTFQPPQAPAQMPPQMPWGPFQAPAPQQTGPTASAVVAAARKGLSSSGVERRRLSEDRKREKTADDESVGRIVSISGLKVEVLLSGKRVRDKDILFCHMGERLYRFEVAGLQGSLAVTVPFDNVRGLRRGIPVYLQEGGLTVPYSADILGKVFNPYGDTIDGSVVDDPNRRNVYDHGQGILCPV